MGHDIPLISQDNDGVGQAWHQVTAGEEDELNLHRPRAEPESGDRFHT